MITLDQIKAVEMDRDDPEVWRVRAGVSITCDVAAGRYKLVKDGPEWMIAEKSLEARRNVLRHIYGDLREPLLRLFDLARNSENSFAAEEMVEDTIAQIKHLMPEIF